jgi:hypothetical protein
MNKTLIFILIAGNVGTAAAGCAAGHTQTVDSGDIYIVTAGNCPSGYTEITPNGVWAPSGDSLCDQSKGSCSVTCTAQ